VYDGPMTCTRVNGNGLEALNYGSYSNVTPHVISV
jgi:hypothetical protein